MFYYMLDFVLTCTYLLSAVFKFEIKIFPITCMFDTFLTIVQITTNTLPHFQSWGAEGYHLWVLPYKQEKRRQEEQEQEEEEVEMVEPPHSSLQAGILQFHFIKSALTVNPCTVRGVMDTYDWFCVYTHSQTLNICVCSLLFAE